MSDVLDLALAAAAHSTTSDEVDPEAVSLSILLATYGAMALGKAQESEDLIETLGARGAHLGCGG